MKKLIFGIFLIALVTIVNFKKDDIYYHYQVYKFKENYKEIDNAYTTSYSFKYAQDINKMQLENITDIKNSIYTLLNSGNRSIKRYCSKEYKNCINDIKEIASNSDLLSYINSFIHPYNSFSNITFSFDGDIGLEIINEKMYSNEDIQKIDEFANKIIKEKITFNMTDEERIKTIHDYIIENTKYDSLKNINIKDKTYHSNTAIGVFFEGYGICSGYSDAMAIMLSKLGYPNYKISNDSHIWNFVLLDDKWYHIDLTWDDPVYTNVNIEKIEYNYFLITSEELKNKDDKEHNYDTNIYKEASI